MQDTPDIFSHVHQLLATHQMIAVIWCVEDVLTIRPDLSDDQAWEILQEVVKQHDTYLGISWNTIEIIAADLYPDPAFSDQE